MHYSDLSESRIRTFEKQFFAVSFSTFIPEGSIYLVSFKWFSHFFLGSVFFSSSPLKKEIDNCQLLTQTQIGVQLYPVITDVGLKEFLKF